MRNKTITYAIEKETGIVLSRVGSEVAYPVLDFQAIGSGGKGDDGVTYEPGDFNGPTRYSLESMSIYAIKFNDFKWTKKIPVRLKNRHRKFWGFKPLKRSGSR